MASDRMYTYCSVLPSGYKKAYSYISDFEISPGAIVVIPIKANNTLKAGLVLDVIECEGIKAPYPPDRTKHILRLFGEDEPEALKEQLPKVKEIQKMLFKVEAHQEMMAVKEALTVYGVGALEREESKEKIKMLLQNTDPMGGKLTDLIEELITDLNDGLVLSSDGKTVVGYKPVEDIDNPVICIPSGVEIIDNNAFRNIKKIKALYIPKELISLGSFTLHKPDIDELKEIGRIVVEAGNPVFTSDGIGFYSLHGGRKRLEYLSDKTISKYIAPDDVVSFAQDCFAHCPNLTQVVLPDNLEEFDEKAFPYDTQVKEVYIPKTVKRLRLRKPSRVGRSEWNRVNLRIDEANEHYFRDEDSIYEVLKDGTYKLLTNTYDGKGRVLILEGTSIIGRQAFEDHKNCIQIEFPESVRIIEKKAFYCTSLKSVTIPDFIENIGDDAFGLCKDLKSAQVPSKLKSMADKAFQGCWQLSKIEYKD